MKIKKLIAGVLAGTMVLGMAVPAFAGHADDAVSNGMISLWGGWPPDGWLNVNKYDITDVYGVIFYVDYDSSNLKVTVVDGEEKTPTIAVSWNSISTGWDTCAKLNAMDENYIKISYLSEEPVFIEDDEWAQVFCQAWDFGDVELTITGADLLGKDGSALLTLEEKIEAEKKAEREKAAAAALKDLQDAMADVADMDSVIDKIDAASSAFSDVTAILAASEEASKTVADLKVALTAAQEAFAALQEGDEADTDTLKALETEINDISKALTAAQDKLSAAQEAFDAETAAQIAAKDKEIAGLKDQVAKLEAEIAELEKQGDADAEKIAELEASIAELEDSITKLEAEKAELKDQLANAGTNTGTGTGDNGSVGAGSTAPVAAVIGLIAAVSVAGIVTLRKRAEA